MGRYQPPEAAPSKNNGQPDHWVGKPYSVNRVFLSSLTIGAWNLTLKLSSVGEEKADDGQ
jgi:hypothetical protein